MTFFSNLAEFSRFHGWNATCLRSIKSCSNARKSSSPLTPTPHPSWDSQHSSVETICIRQISTSHVPIHDSPRQLARRFAPPAAGQSAEPVHSSQLSGPNLTGWGSWKFCLECWNIMERSASISLFSLCLQVSIQRIRYSAYSTCSAAKRPCLNHLVDDLHLKTRIMLSQWDKWECKIHYAAIWQTPTVVAYGYFFPMNP